MDPEELALVRETLRHALATESPAGVIGSLRELGYVELIADDPAAAWSTLFDTQGDGAVASPVLDLVAADALGLGSDTDTAIVYPTFTDHTRPPARLSGDGVTIDGIVLAGVERAPGYTIAVDTGDGVALATVPTTSAGIELRSIKGFDPALGLSAITGTVTTPDLEPTDRWDLAITRSQRAIAQEITGVSQHLLTMALAHVTSREQFGAPIAVFQTVKHRLADVHVAVTASRAALEAAWTTDDPFITTVTKAIAGQAHTTAVRNCQQVCGAIGFTWEFDMHRYTKRGIVLDAFLGASTTLRTGVGATLATARSVPRHGHLTAAG